MIQQVIQPEPGNLIVSPYSVASALALLSQATNGNTFEELKKGLHLSGDKSSIADQYLGYYGTLQKGARNTTLSVANQLFVQQGYKLNKNFQDVAVQKFFSGVDSVDFSKPAEAAQTINHFVEEKTHEKIKNLFAPDSLSSDSRVVLVNAIYMKAKWEREFEDYETRKSDFYMNEADKVSVDFMHSEEPFNYGVLADLEASALEMKYVDSDFSFLMVLPNSRTGLSALETKLNNYDLTKITEQMHKQLVNVTIPKFKVESEISLNDILKKVCAFHILIYCWTISVNQRNDPI